MVEIDYEYINRSVSKLDVVYREGIVTEVVGLKIEAKGFKGFVGEVCKVINNERDEVLTEIVGFKQDTILLMPLGEVSGISTGCVVVPLSKRLEIACGEALLGRVLDGIGNPIDGQPLNCKDVYPLDNKPPNPLTREIIKEVLPTGIKAIDSLITCGEGQRVGIFAGSGVGKSTTMGMIAREAKADINVICLVGERGRELNEFIRDDLKEEGLKKSVVVCATSEQPPLLRVKAALTATAIAEYFRDKGKRVILMMDSVTRFAMAQREIGLSIGEPPTQKGYTPSVFSLLPKLMERAGKGEVGSITAFYTVLVDSDDFNEPISDAARSILDGHIILSRDLADKNHYPPIDVLKSISRIMSKVIDSKQKENSTIIKEIMASYREAEDLINIGAYVKGANKKVDIAVKHIDEINKFLRQNIDEKVSFNEVIDKMNNLANLLNVK